MKKIILSTALAILTIQGLMAQATKPPRVKVENLPDMGYRTVTNNAFKAGEWVKYRIRKVGDAITEKTEA